MTKHPSKTSQVQIFWNEILKEPEIKKELANNGFFRISSGNNPRYHSIKKLTESINNERTSRGLSEITTEARLLTKFDHKKDLPPALIENQLSVLSIANKDYIISHVNPFFQLKSSILPPKYINPKLNRLLDPFKFTSEKAGMVLAFNTGIIDDFLGEHVELSVNGLFGYDHWHQDKTKGRFSSKFHPEVPLEIGNTQIEVDMSYESDNQIAILEANDAGRPLPSSLTLRQLYYPLKEFRLRDSLLNQARQIKLIYMNTHNDFLTFFEIRSTDESTLESFELVKQVDYKFKDPEFVNKLQDVYKKTTVKSPETEDGKSITFPQADKVVDNMLPYLASFKIPKTAKDIANMLNYVERQGNYYGDALAYIGLVSKRKQGHSFVYTLTKLGEDYINRRDDFSVASRLLTLPVFRNIIKKTLDDNFVPTLPEIIEQMNIEKVTNDQADTTRRRAQTVKTVVEWVANQIIN